MVGNQQQFKREYRFQPVVVYKFGDQNHTLFGDVENVQNYGQLHSRMMMIINFQYSGAILFSFRIALTQVGYLFKGFLLINKITFWQNCNEITWTHILVYQSLSTSGPIIWGWRNNHLNNGALICSVMYFCLVS